jgi:hypothetical protein
MARLDWAIHEGHEVAGSLLDGRVKPGHDNQAAATSYILQRGGRNHDC